MPHGMVTWETCGRNLRLRPKYPFLWVLVPAMHSQVRSTFHTLAHSSSQPLSGVDHITTLIVQLEKLRLSERTCVCVCARVVSCANSLPSHRLWPTRLLCQWDFPGKNTGVGCHALLQEIFLTQGSQSGPHRRQILYQKGNHTAKRRRLNVAPESTFLKTAFSCLFPSEQVVSFY